MKNYKIIEVTKENEREYLSQIENLELKVLNHMETEGKKGQLFITGREDISNYIHSQENKVIIAVDENNSVISAVYITQGQKPFTYNDITKYFKYGNEYKNYVKNIYGSGFKYKKIMLETYNIKIEAYKEAKRRILKEYKQEDIDEFLQTKTDEKNSIREKLNQYMSEYIEEKEMQTPGIKKQYEQFYWITRKDIAEELNKDISKIKPNQDILECDEMVTQEYDSIIKNSHLKIHEKPEFQMDKYYSANPDNSIEIDTYLTNPENRHYGMARILVYEGIKNKIEEIIKQNNQNEIFLCSTLHRDNLSSKYVSEFFGLTDSLYVQRRQDRDREVHIYKIPKGKAEEYLRNIAEKLSVLYGYNTDQIDVSPERKIEILKEQLEYEKNQFKLVIKKSKIRKNKNEKHSGMSVSNEVKSKVTKIAKLEARIKDIEKESIKKEEVR